MSTATLDVPSAVPPIGASTAHDLEQRHGSGVYGQRRLTLVRGEGAHLFDADGTRYIDCLAAQGAASLGHGHPRLAAAIANQAQTLIASPSSFPNDVRARFLERLADVTGYARFFLANSGTEAVEGALKFACLLTGRKKLLAVRRAFHGRTLGALAVTARAKYREPFAGLLAEAEWLRPEDPAAAEAAIDDTVAAVIVEPIQGEGGVHPLSAEYLAALRRLCDAHGALLIFDEVQTGFGRTGAWLAHRALGIPGDLVALAKGIAGGVPMGAVGLAPHLLRDGQSPLTVGSHGSTFGGSPLACAAGLATLDTLREERLPERAGRLGRWALDTLRQAFVDVPAVRDVRGRGLLIGIDLRSRVGPLVRTLMEEHHILTLAAGPTVLRLLPPLVIEDADWRRVIETVISIIGRHR